MNALRWLLFPFSLLYGTVAAFRNFLFDRRILSSTRYSVPVIAIGNVSVGGAGKSPMTEYLVRLLHDAYNIGIVSRGYGRKTKGVRPVELTSSAKEVGDEPLQFKTKFSDVPIWVSEQRRQGIETLIKKHPSTNLILLDDAYQHRQVDPAIALVLMEYNDVLERQYPMPMGRLREWMSGIKRADVIVITKCPKLLSRDEQARIQKRLGLSNEVALYFSSIEYGALVGFGSDGSSLDLSKDLSVLLVTGIANPDPLIRYVKHKVQYLQSMRFRDHHAFTKSDMTRIREAFDALPGLQKVLIFTEKDSMRLKDEELMLRLENLPLYYLPIKTVMQPSAHIGFDDRIKLLLTHR